MSFCQYLLASGTHVSVTRADCVLGIGVVPKLIPLNSVSWLCGDPIMWLALMHSQNSGAKKHIDMLIWVGGNSKIFVLFTLNLGEMIQFDSYF